MSEPVCPNARRGEEHAIVGVEIPGIYDGVLFWQCEVDGARIHRWLAGRLREATERYWREHPLVT